MLYSLDGPSPKLCPVTLIAQHKLSTIASDWLTNLKSFSYFIPFLADFCYLARSGGVL